MDGARRLNLVPATGRWCVVRWNRDRFCGPLSSDGVFPKGQIGPVATFATQDEARAAAAKFDTRLRDTIDIPTPIGVLHFSATVYSHYDGSTRVSYDDGDLDQAQQSVWTERGRAAEGRDANYIKVELDCRPTDALAPFAPPGADLSPRK